jgi:ketosteroid isomerase-like protein
VTVGNAELVIRRFEAQRDGRPLPGDLDPDVVVAPDPRWPEAGEYRGIGEVTRFFAQYYEEFSGFSLDWDEPVEAGDRVVIRFRMGVTGRASGVEVVNEASAVHTFRDGRIARIEYFFDHDQALVAAGIGSTTSKVEIARQVRDLLVAGDVDAAAELFHPNAELRMRLGTFRGREGLKEWQQDVHHYLGDYEFSGDEYIEAGDSVVHIATVRARGRDVGLEIEQEIGYVLKIDDGKVVAAAAYPSKEEALKAAGSAAP